MEPLKFQRLIHEDRRQSSNWFDMLADIMQEGIAVLNRDGILVYTNRSLGDMLGYLQSELLGHHWSEFFDEANAAIENQQLGKLHNNEHIAFEIAWTAKGGHRVATFVSSIPIFDRQGRCQSTLMVVVDLSSRKNADNALKELEKKCATLAESSLTGIYIVMDGHIVYANGNFARIFGYSEEETIGLELHELSPAVDRLINDQRCRMILDKHTSIRQQFARGLKKDGNVIWLKTSDTYIDYHGKPAILGHVIDVTQEKQMEDILWKSKKESRILSTQLLRGQEQERKRIASELHDGIGQSLTAIKLYLENFDRLASQPNDTLDGEQPILTNITPLLQETIDQVRRISMELRPSTLDELGVLATINWFLRKFRSSYPDVLLEAHIDITESDVPACYKTLIFRVIQEALNNIAKHAQANIAQLDLKRRDDFIELKIRDDGIGFELSEVLTQHPLQRGLGLASMKERCESVGGSFTVVSSAGSGTLLLADWPGEKSRSYCCS